MPHQLTPTEAELLKLIDHILKCDLREMDCPICENAYQRLLDGNVHALEDPDERAAQVDAGMAQLTRRMEDLCTHLEGAPVQPSIRRYVADMIEGIGKIRGVMRLPLTTNRPNFLAPPLKRVKPPRIPALAFQPTSG